MSPRARFWFVSIAAAATVGVTGALGFWQLSRAAQKQALEDRIEERAALAPLGASDLLPAPPDLDALLHRPVVLRGRWLAEASVYLDNRPMAGRSGFILVTPLQPTGFKDAVLVQRGWVPRDFRDRSKVPEVPTPADEVEVRGRLAPPPSRLFELGAAETGRIRQNLDLAAVAHTSGLSLPALSVLQTGASPEGLLREWPRFESAVHKHHGYAAQWFAMSAVTAGLYAWFQLISPRRRRKLHGQDPR
jgi:surfeit locus 1 family protein